MFIYHTFPFNVDKAEHELNIQCHFLSLRAKYEQIDIRQFYGICHTEDNTSSLLISEQSVKLLVTVKKKKE